MTTQRIGFAVLFVLALGAGSWSQDRRSADFETLEGTWIVELNAPPTPKSRVSVETHSGSPSARRRSGRRCPSRARPRK